MALAYKSIRKTLIFNDYRNSRSDSIEIDTNEAHL